MTSIKGIENMHSPIVNIDGTAFIIAVTGREFKSDAAA
jgi:hypothetical protein